MKNGNRNPIAEQSCIWLMQSLVRIMERKPYSTITIGEIAKEAQLARRTFYRNFTSKDEVLFLYMQRLCGEYEMLLSQRGDLSLSSIAYVFFCFWSEHSDFLRLLESNKMTPFLLQTFSEHLPSLHATLKKDIKKRFIGQEEALAYALAFSVGGFFNMLAKWMQDGMHCTPDEMAAMVKYSLLFLKDSQTFQ